jgi:hypothetical protein
MRLRVIATLVLTLGLAGSASAQSIGVYWDPAGATWCVNQPAPAFGVMYILATLGGAAAGGMTGAEFRVSNFPSDWNPGATPNPSANLTFGNPLAAGCNIGFPSCQTGSGGVVLLYTVVYFAVDVQTDRQVTVLRHTTPSNMLFQCPLLTLCNAPTFTKVCVNGAQGTINGGPCTVAVEQRSWSGVKRIFD